MFEVGFTEILLISTLALIVLGPEKLPRVARQLGRWMGKARSMARQFREQLEEEVDLAETPRTRKPSTSSSSETGSASAAAGTTAGAAGTAAASASENAPYSTPEGETYTPYTNIADPPPPPPEVAAADAAAETAHSENPNAPAPEPEASAYEPPAYANGGTHEHLHEDEPSAAKSSTVESPPSNSDEEAPRKAGDYITTTHERSI